MIVFWYLKRGEIAKIGKSNLRSNDHIRVSKAVSRIRNLTKLPASQGYPFSIFTDRHIDQLSDP